MFPKPLQAIPIALALTLGHSAGAGAAPPTTIIDYRPAAPEGKEQTGSCFSTSVAAPRADAWRCTVGNAIFDPCFSLDDTNVACDTDPVKRQTGFRLHLSEPLPAAESASGKLPPAAAAAIWLVELDDGTICNRATGARAAVQVNGGIETATYYCSDDSMILGDLRAEADSIQGTRAFLAPGAAQPAASKTRVETFRTVWK